MKLRITGLFVLSAAVAGARAGAAQEPAVWRLSAEPLLQIGVVEGAPEYQLFRAVSSVRLGDGRIAVLNAGSHELRFYDAEGRFVASVGRRGKGPGEFLAPARLYRMAADSLMVFDRANVRFSVHAPDGTFVRSEPVAEERRFRFAEWLYDRSWIDGPALGRGRGSVRAAIDRLPAPDPAVGYRYVKVSPQGHLWVRRPVAPGAPVEWIVYDLEARPIGQVTTPARFEIHEIGRDYLLGVWRDELDVEYIRLYAMSGAERAPVGTLADDVAAGPAPARSLPPAALNEVRRAIKNLATLQELHYSTGDFRYAADTDQLDGWEAPENLLVRIVNATPHGWTGLIIDERTGATCGLSYGAYPPVGWMPGVVLCETSFP
ncbi:MAG TPA: 6-bladed beta-propeller [Longimicrobiales bacterium]